MLVLSSTVASYYYNCCTDSTTSPENYGYRLISESEIERDIVTIYMPNRIYTIQ
jgi:hypothetical protein